MCSANNQANKEWGGGKSKRQAHLISLLSWQVLRGTRQRRSCLVPAPSKSPARNPISVLRAFCSRWFCQDLLHWGHALRDPLQLFHCNIHDWPPWASHQGRDREGEVRVSWWRGELEVATVWEFGKLFRKDVVCVRDNDWSQGKWFWSKFRGLLCVIKKKWDYKYIDEWFIYLENSSICYLKWVFMSHKSNVSTKHNFRTLFPPLIFPNDISFLLEEGKGPEGRWPREHWGLRWCAGHTGAPSLSDWPACQEWSQFGHDDTWQAHHLLCWRDPSVPLKVLICFFLNKWRDQCQ